jgi:L-rhamnose isomerase
VSEYPIASDAIDAHNAARIADLRRDYETLGRGLRGAAST